MKNKVFAILAISLLVGPMSANAVPVQVTVSGTVDSNLINSGGLGGVNPGDAASMSFLLDSDNFLNSASFPVRGYVIDPLSFLFTLGSTTVGLQSPKATTSYFVIRDNDPAVDGFYLAEGQVDSPFVAVPPLDEAGVFGQFGANFLATYTGDTLSSLNILDALGTYDFTGLTTFQWTVKDGPFDPMTLVFDSVTISAVDVPEPETLALLGFGLAGLGFAKRRKAS